MTRLAALVTVAVLATSAAAVARQPTAADRATARSLAFAGQEALDKKQYALALDRFTRANNLVPAPTFELRIARAEVGLGKLVEAHETYERILLERVAPDSPAVFQQAVDSATKEVAALEPRLPWVTIVAEPGSAKVTIDGVEVPAAELGVRRAIDPGARIFRATADGYAPLDKTVTFAEGQSQSVTLSLQKVAAAPDAERVPRASPPADTGALGGEHKTTGWHKTAGWVALGVGAAGLIVGGVEGAVALHQHSELSGPCSSGTCPASENSRLDAYHTAGTVSTIGFIVGAVGVGAGVTLLLTAPKRQAAYIAPYLGPGAVGARGRF